MAAPIEEFPDLRVSVDDVVYMPGLETPPGKPHPFVYFISIHNRSDVSLTVLARKWVVRERGGETTVVEGAGVVGQTPVIPPGQHFSYNSYHVVAREAVANGAFFGETADGRRIFARIPEFTLKLPAKEV
ncbi:MAG: ApaG domain [Akkermansiaceae bacterium]|nr:ApaG domain [Akkermansiaceae bacterium]MCF7731354.1 ApaG domain [Akkermansiaceae bacterium]